MAWWIWLIIGVFSGTIVGIFAICLVSMSRDWNYPEYDDEIDLRSIER
jgi:hypothetical protein